MSSILSEMSTIRHCGSANTSVSSDVSGRVPGIHYPTVSVEHPRSPTVSLKKQIGQYSATSLQYDNVKHRCRMLETENQRLLRTQADIVDDSNRRVDMHMNEIRMLKEENKKLQQSNKELRDLACFLDDDRQRARRMAREWHKFGRYTSQVMKQEIMSYQQRSQEMEKKCTQITGENDELKQLCLYLDEHRQSLISCKNVDEESEDLGCGSSERSEESDRPEETFNQEKEHCLRMISAQMQTSSTSEEVPIPAPDSERLINYIHSLESRIRHLEQSQPQQDSLWGSDTDEKTIIDRGKEIMNIKKMEQSTTSTMTSSCTTYGSTDTDGESAVYVMGDDIECFPGCEVRTLGKIEEEKEADDDSVLPPPLAPLSASLLSVGRLSLSSDSDFHFGDGLARSFSASHSPSIRSPKPSPRASSVDRYSLSVCDAVRILRIGEKTDQSTIKPLHQLYSTAWSNSDSSFRSDVSLV